MLLWEVAALIQQLYVAMETLVVLYGIEAVEIAL
jgi:hypothetical protein